MHTGRRLATWCEGQVYCRDTRCLNQSLLPRRNHPLDYKHGLLLRQVAWDVGQHGQPRRPPQRGIEGQRKAFRLPIVLRSLTLWALHVRPDIRPTNPSRQRYKRTPPPSCSRSTACGPSKRPRDVATRGRGDEMQPLESADWPLYPNYAYFSHGGRYPSGSSSFPRIYSILFSRMNQTLVEGKSRSSI